jgi:hypothetical protein
VQARRRERHAVVGANGTGQAELPEEALEVRVHRERLGGAQALAGEQIARVEIRDCEGIAVFAVAGAELALEVGRPEIVRGVRRGRHDARMRGAISAPARFDQSGAFEHVARGADRGLAHSRVPKAEPVHEFLRAPVTVLASRLAEERRDLVRHLVRAVVGRAARIGQALPTLPIVAGHPFVAHTTTDLEPGAELGHREAAGVIGINENGSGDP